MEDLFPATGGLRPLDLPLDAVSDVDVLSRVASDPFVAQRLLTGQSVLWVFAQWGKEIGEVKT